MNNQLTALSWSGGKDSCMTLHRLKESGQTPRLLVCTLSAEHRRISMHGVHESLLDAQAAALEIPLKKVYLPDPCPMEKYDAIMRKLVDELKAQGITHMAYGDLFLEDLKNYRESKLEGTGIEPLFPLWLSDTTELVHEFIELGYLAKVVATDDAKLDPSFCGRNLDKSFIQDLPQHVDPCGENGEFHSFVYGGPIFQQTLAIQAGDNVQKHYGSDDDSFKSSFHFCELRFV